MSEAVAVAVANQEIDRHTDIYRDTVCRLMVFGYTVYRYIRMCECAGVECGQQRQWRWQQRQ